VRSFDDRKRPVQLDRVPVGPRTYPKNPPLRFSDLQMERMRFVEPGVVISATLLSISAVSLFVAVRMSPKLMYVLGIGCVVWIVLLVASLGRSARRNDRIYAIHYLPSQGICPACGHSLRGLAPEADGCVVCPECGAAWRLPVVQSSNPS